MLTKKYTFTRNELKKIVRKFKQLKEAYINKPLNFYEKLFNTKFRNSTIKKIDSFIKDIQKLLCSESKRIKNKKKFRFNTNYKDAIVGFEYLL